MDDSVLDTLGSPLVEIDGPAGATVAAKLESRNPGGSAKDRPALAMVEAAETAGELAPGDRLVEPTSGNTGIGLALVAAVKGYDLTLVMPASKSPERRGIMRAYGAELELVDGDIAAARERADAIEAAGAVQLAQFANPANPDAHEHGTGQELLNQLGEPPDAFVAGVGTGGTITGVGRRLRAADPDVTIVAVEPASRPAIAAAMGDPEAQAVMDAGHADDFQGMGPGFVSENTDLSLIDRLETIALDDAEAACRRLAREEGLLVGQSSGAAAIVARDVARDLEADGDRADAGGEAVVATVFWDRGERYLSTGLFDD